MSEIVRRGGVLTAWVALWMALRFRTNARLTRTK